MRKSEAINVLEFQKASDAKAYFDNVIREMSGIKIKYIFSNCASFNHYAGYRVYSDCSPITIVFENEQCLILDYPFIDALRMELRPISAEELARLQDPLTEDYFNCSVDIYNSAGGVIGDIYETAIISLEYDTLVDVELRPVNKEYEKWIGRRIDYVLPTEETFSAITFIMGNGNTFTICAESATCDGYISAWSADAKETIIRHK